MTFRAIDLTNMIKEHGREVVYTSKGDNTYTPSTGTVTSTDEEFFVKVYFYNYSLGDVDGTNILLGDRRAAMPVTDVNGNSFTAPSKGDTLEGEGDNVKIVSVDRIMSGNDPVGYLLQVRE